MYTDQLADSYRAQIKERTALATQAIERMHASALSRVHLRLSSLYRDIATMQQNVSAAENIPMTPLPMSRLEAIRQDVYNAVSHFAEHVKLTVKQLMHFAAGLGTKAARLFLGEAFPFDQATIPPVPDLPGQEQERLNELFAIFGGEASEQVSQVLITGVTVGRKVKAIADEVTRALDSSRARAITIADTEVFRAFNAVLHRAYQANISLVQYWVWQCQLSPRSCAACVALHGSKHPMSEELHDHPNGSCVKVPYVAGTVELQSGEEWFAQQPEEVQRAILGTKVAFQHYQTHRDLRQFICMDSHPGYGINIHQCSLKEIQKGVTSGSS